MKDEFFWSVFFTVFFETADLRSYCGYFLAIGQLCYYNSNFNYRAAGSFPVVPHQLSGYIYLRNIEIINCSRMKIEAINLIVCIFFT